MATVKRKIELGSAAAEGEGARQRLQGLGDRRRRDAGDGGRAVDGGAVFLEDVEGALRVEDHAGLGEHLERGLMDALHGRGLDDLQPAPGADATTVGVRRHRSLVAAPVGSGCRRAPLRMKVRVTKGEVAARTRAS